MRRTLMEKAFANIQVNAGEPLTPLHKKLIRSMERREKFRKQRKTTKAR